MVGTMVACSNIKKADCALKPGCVWVKKCVSDQNAGNSAVVVATKTKTKTKTRNAQWDNLPLNIQRLIVKDITDPHNQARLAAVTKNMHAIAPKVQFTPYATILLDVLGDILKGRNSCTCTLVVSHGFFRLEVGMDKDSIFFARATITQYGNSTAHTRPGYVFSDHLTKNTPLSHETARSLNELRTKLRARSWTRLDPVGVYNTHVLPNLTAREQDVDRLWPVVVLDSFNAFSRCLSICVGNQRDKPRLDIELQVMRGKQMHFINEIPERIMTRAAKTFDVHVARDLPDKALPYKVGLEQRYTFLQYSNGYVPTRLFIFARAPIHTKDGIYELCYPSYTVAPIRALIKHGTREYIRVPIYVDIKCPTEGCPFASVPGQDSILHFEPNSLDATVFRLYVDVPRGPRSTYEALKQIGHNMETGMPIHLIQSI